MGEETKSEITKYLIVYGYDKSQSNRVVVK